MINKRRTIGISVVEVLIALAILGIGVAAAAQMQATSLRYSRQAEQIKTATQVAEGEVEWRRQTELDVGTGLDCASYIPDGYSCAVTIEPCHAVGTALEITCSAGLVSPVAYRIAVEVGTPSGTTFELATISTGTYVTGVIGSGEVVDLPPTGTDPPVDDPTDPGDEGPDPRPCIRYNPQGKCTKYG